MCHLVFYSYRFQGVSWNSYDQETKRINSDVVQTINGVSTKYRFLQDFKQVCRYPKCELQTLKAPNKIVAYDILLLLLFLLLIIFRKKLRPGVSCLIFSIYIKKYPKSFHALFSLNIYKKYPKSFT